MSLSQKTVTGVFWTFLEMSGRQGIGILVTLILAHFLTPGDFGLVAMLSVFFSIANSIMDAGFRQALIRKKEATSLDYSTVFVTNVVLGFLSYALLFLSGPAIAAFYREPQLVLLTRVVGVIVIINSFQIVQVVELTRRLDFKTQFKVTLPAAFISGFVAIAMAAKGFGVWSLAAQMVISPLVITLGFWRINSWRPSAEFSLESFKELFGFGSKLFLSGILDILFRNLYVIVIGKLFAATVVGWYFFATKIIDLALAQLTGSIQRASYPALASIQDDEPRLKEAYRKVVLVTVYVLFPSISLLAALAKPLFSLLLNPKWYPAAFYLQLLCAAALVYPLHAINLNILQVKGRSDLFLFLEVVKKALAVIVLVVSLPFGIIGLLLGQILSSVLSYIPNSYYSAKMINYPASEQVKDIFPTLCISFLSGGTALLCGRILLPFLDLPLRFLSQAFVGIMAFILFAHVTQLESQQILWGLAKSRISQIRASKEPGR